MRDMGSNGGPAPIQWGGDVGCAWVEAQAILDRMYQVIEDRLAAAIPTGAQVLDIGCGTGATTLAAAWQAGEAGAALGLDISEPMIAAARDRAARAGSPARFVRADAQRHAFEPGRFDRIISRFGVMFFDDPVAAFANLRSAAAADGMLHAIAWRGGGENPFMTAAERVAAPLLPGLPARDPDGPGQFAFADPGKVQAMLEASGWREIDIAPADFACAFPAEALDAYLVRLGPVGRALQGADSALRARVLDAVRPAFEPYVHGAEVRFTAACWEIRGRA